MTKRIWEERIDHRSHAERGLDEHPTIHEGVSARKMEKAGFVSERCETNRLIRADNAVIRAMKAAIVKLKKIIETTIPAIAAAMETIRQNIIVFNYGLLFVRDRRKETREYVEQATREYGNYKDTHSQIKAKIDERKKLQKEHDGLSVFNISKRKELKTKIAELSEEIEELRFEEKSVMRAFGKDDAAGMKNVENEISKSKSRIVELNAQEVEFTGAIKREKAKFDGLKEQSADLDQDELIDARLALRPQMERAARDRVTAGLSSGKPNFWMTESSFRDADRLLDEEGMPFSSKPSVAGSAGKGGAAERKSVRANGANASRGACDDAGKQSARPSLAVTLRAQFAGRSPHPLLETEDSANGESEKGEAAHLSGDAGTVRKDCR